MLCLLGVNVDQTCLLKSIHEGNLNDVPKLLRHVQQLDARLSASLFRSIFFAVCFRSLPNQHLLVGSRRTQRAYSCSDIDL